MSETKNKVGTVKFTLDGKEVSCHEGVNLVQALGENGVEVPTLCWSPGIEPCLGTCRVCTMKVNGRETAACALKIEAGMKIECDTPELKDLRQGILELLFVEGNHFCPGCEKSGDCELQGLAYKFGMSHPRFPYRFTHYELDYRGTHLLLERNRCIHCKRCTELFADDEGRKVFSFVGKGKDTRVEMNLELEAKMPIHKCREAAALCPTGAIILKGQGFDRPVGTRRFDHLSGDVKVGDFAEEKK